jgi:hypothetical protein
LTLLVAATSALAAIYVQHYAQYPMPMWRGWVFRYLLFHQDMPGLALLVAIAGSLAFRPRTVRRLPSWRPSGAGPGRAPRSPSSRSAPERFRRAKPRARRRRASDADAEPHLRCRPAQREVPPELMPWLMADFYRYRWIMLDPHTGEFVSIYWPGFALLLTPFTRLGVPWACNPLLAALSLVLIGRLASRLTQSPQAGGWAILLAAGSPAFGGFALSYFPMTAHLLLNLLFAWLLIERGRRGLVSAGLVGSSHSYCTTRCRICCSRCRGSLWFGMQPEGRRNLALLSFGYLPGLAIGLAWAAYIRGMHGFIIAAPFPSDGEFLNELGNLYWYWTFRSSYIFGIPQEYAIGGRIGEQVRLWAWAVPGLPILALAGWWLGRRNAPLNLLALSVAVTIADIFSCGSTRATAGERATSIRRGARCRFSALRPSCSGRRDLKGDAALRGWVASAATLSLVFATALRWWQIHDYISEHLARRPPHVEGARQIVFIRPDRDYYYDQDLVQNDPFLREPTVYLLSRAILGQRDDAQAVPASAPGLQRPARACLAFRLTGTPESPLTGLTRLAAPTEHPAARDIVEAHQDDCDRGRRSAPKRPANRRKRTAPRAKAENCCRPGRGSA